VDKAPLNISDKGRYVFGNAADLEVLKKAGIMKAPSVIITTHDDDMNIYLSIYCRRLRPDIQIISRATNDKNVTTLHRAGADFVMSTTMMGTNTILNLLKHSNILMVLEGLDVFNLNVPDSLVGKKIIETPIRQETGCSIIAIRHDNSLQINPDPNLTLPAGAEIILIGNKAAEKKFLKLYGNSRT
jgi:Trk K+ transport system NAD-binding subunit